MVVFGGAGDGTELHSDTWKLQLGNQASWHQAAPMHMSPPARSSHVCAAWRGRAVLHGGLGQTGVFCDTWLFDGEWIPLACGGPAPFRAHHCGAVVKDDFLLFSGQDADLLSTNTICSLDLKTCTWSVACLGDAPGARIDAACVAFRELGLVIFGGVNPSFEFEAPTPWLLSETAVAPIASAAPGQRACASLCASGLHLYVFGGFDGEKDQNSLWDLSLVPSELVDARVAQDDQAA